MSAPARYAVWLDYNDDGQFSSTELLTSGTTNYNSSSGTLSVTSDFSGSYTIPSTGVTYCKPLRMRLMVDTAAVNSNSPGLNPCGPVLYGQIIDYAIVVMPATSGTNVTAASISLTAGTNPSCPNSSQTFTAITTPSNTGTVLWYVNGSLVSTGAVTYTTSSLAHGSVVTAKVAFNGTCGPDTISTNSITINRTTPVTPSVSIAMTAGSNPSCINTSLTFTATPTNAVGTTTYQWFVNGNAVGTGSTYTASNFANGDQVYVEMTAAGTCVSSATYQSSSITLQRTSTSNSISLNITQGSNPTCAGAALTLSAQMTSPGNAPTYTWYRNGNLITGVTSATYVPSTYTNGDVFRVIGTSNDPCVTVSTDTADLSITVTPPLNPSVSIAITTGSNPSCQGDVVTYKATPSNQTNSPSYRWFVNGTFTGVTTDSFSSNALANGSVVRVEMTADGTCSPAYVTMSNAITQTVQLFTPVAQLQVPSGALPTCTYNSITFSATSTNGGTAPVYTWLLNGTTVGTGNNYTGTGFTNGDELALVVTSNAQCLSRSTDTAKQIISVTTPVNPTVSIALTAGANPSCVGTSVTYTATPNGVVGSAFYDWKINGTSIGVTTPSFTSTGINDNDVISVEMYAGGVCVLPIYVTSNSITHNTYSFTPTVSISQFAGPNPACSYDFVTYRANYTYGGGNPTFAWYINGVYQANSNHFQFTTSGLNVGDVVSVEMTSNDVCAQPKLATDAINANINPVIPPVATIAITNGSNPSCVGVPVEFTASPTLNTSTPTYVWMVNGNPVGVTTATFTTSTLVNNDIVSVSMTAAGQCFLPMPVLSNQIWMDIYSILPEVSISQTIGSNPACDYDTLTFTATPVNGGSGPVFDWYVNGVQMGTGNSFTKTNFANKDQLSVRLTSNDVCAQPKLAYDTVEIDILPRQNPNIAIALTDGRIPGCEDSVLTFESTVSGSGTNPIVDWFVGTTSLLNNNPILSKANLPNGQEIYAVVTPVGGCFNYFSDTSNAILILNEPQSVQPKLSLVGHTLISDVKPPLMWYGPNGFISQVVTDTFNPTIQGDYYVISTSSPNCHSLPSNVLNIILNLGVVNYDMSTLSIYPNPTREKLTIDWNGIVQNQVDITVYSELGQIVHQSRFEGASTYQIDCSRLASGQYYIQIVDVNGEQGIAKFIVE